MSELQNCVHRPAFVFSLSTSFVSKRCWVHVGSSEECACLKWIDVSVWKKAAPHVPSMSWRFDRCLASFVSAGQA